MKYLRLLLASCCYALGVLFLLPVLLCVWAAEVIYPDSRII